MSLLNLASLTSNRLISFKTECGSVPTSSRKSRPNNSRHMRHLPKMKFADILDISGAYFETDDEGNDVS